MTANEADISVRVEAAKRQVRLTCGVADITRIEAKPLFGAKYRINVYAPSPLSEGGLIKTNSIVFSTVVIV